MAKLTIEEKYADPAVVKFWQQLGKQGLQQAEKEMVSRYLPTGGHLLDLGCGAGRAVLGLSQKGYTVTGIDLSLPMLQAGRILSAEMQLSGANLLALPFADNTFTAAFMFFGALQHIPGRRNRRQALAGMARVVRPGGRLILGLDNLAPTLTCYAYWFKEKVLKGKDKARRVESSAAHKHPADVPGPHAVPSTTADTVLWGRNTHPLLWHLRGVTRSLRWRTWPGWVDLARHLSRRSNGPKPGDMQVAQFSRPATPGRVYYHIYRTTELLADAASAGWLLLGYHAGSELTEMRIYPNFVRGQDKQLFFAFQKVA